MHTNSIEIQTMKNYIPLVIAILLSSLNYAWSQNSNPQPIPIAESSENTNTDGRSASYMCSAYYYSSSSTVEVNTFGLGVSTICLYDSSNRLLDSTITSEEDDVVFLCVPSRSGYYRLVITAHSYYGVGVIDLHGRQPISN